MKQNDNNENIVEQGAEKPSKAWEKPVVMRLAVNQAEGANNYDDDSDFKGAS